MVKQFIVVILISGLGLQGLTATSSTLSKVKSALIDGAWSIIKPFDTISDQGVTVFTPHGPEKKTMEEMQQEIIKNWDSISQDRYSEPEFVKFNLDNNYTQDDAQNKRFLKYVKYKRDAIDTGAKKEFSIFQDVPQKKHIAMYWYGTGCQGKRVAVKLAHYTPITYLASYLKWLAITALVGTAIEEGIELVKKIRGKQKKEKTNNQGPTKASIADA